MKTSKDKWNQAVSKLIELTQSDLLEWTAAVDDHVSGMRPSDKIEGVYITTYNQNRLRIYNRIFERAPDLSAMKMINPATFLLGRESEVILEVSSIDRGGWWQFPKVSSLHDLYESVRYQAAGVNDFLNTLLGN